MDAISLADAIVEELAAWEGSVTEFDVERRVKPEYAIKDLTGLKIAVTPKGIAYTTATRGSTTEEYEVFIGIAQKIDGDADSVLADLLAFVKSVVVFMNKRLISVGAETAVWLKTVNDPIYSVDELSNKRVFVSLLTVTYRVLA